MAAPVSPGRSVGMSASSDFVPKFRDFRTAFDKGDYAEVKRLISDSIFMQEVFTKERGSLIEILGRMVDKSSGQWDLVQTLFSRYRSELDRCGDYMPDNLLGVVLYLDDPRVCQTMSPDAVNRLAASMARLQNWSVVEPLLNERLKDLSFECLSDIAEELPLEHPQFANIVAKILPKLIAEKSEVSAGCLSRLARKILATGKAEIKPIGEAILRGWNRISPYPLIPTTRADVELIMTHAPEQVGGCLMSLVYDEGKIDTRGLIGKYAQVITAEKLGNILFTVTLFECTKHLINYDRYQPRQRFIEEILGHPEAAHISQDILRHALVALTVWKEKNQGALQLLRTVSQRHEALCETLKKLIAS